MATQLVRRMPPRMAPARARWATVHIETASHRYVGRLFVPETKKRVSDVLCDDRPFLCLTDVATDGSPAIEPFLALNKRFVHSVRILDEGGDASGA